MCHSPHTHLSSPLFSPHLEESVECSNATQALRLPCEKERGEGMEVLLEQLEALYEVKDYREAVEFLIDEEHRITALLSTQATDEQKFCFYCFSGLSFLGDRSKEKARQPLLKAVMMWPDPIMLYHLASCFANQGAQTLKCWRWSLKALDNLKLLSCRESRSCLRWKINLQMGSELLCSHGSDFPDTTEKKLLQAWTNFCQFASDDDSPAWYRFPQWHPLDLAFLHLQRQGAKQSFPFASHRRLGEAATYYLEAKMKVHFSAIFAWRGIEWLQKKNFSNAILCFRKLEPEENELGLIRTLGLILSHCPDTQTHLPPELKGSINNRKFEPLFQALYRFFKENSKEYKQNSDQIQRLLAKHRFYATTYPCTHSEILGFLQKEKARKRRKQRKVALGMELNRLSDVKGYTSSLRSQTTQVTKLKLVFCSNFTSLLESPDLLSSPDRKAAQKAFTELGEVLKRQTSCQLLMAFNLPRVGFPAVRGLLQHISILHIESSPAMSLVFRELSRVGRSSPHVLQELNISEHIEPGAVRHLANFLRQTKSLTSLEIEHSSLSVTSKQILFPAIANCKSLRNLSLNELDESMEGGLDEVMSALAQHKTKLEMLELKFATSPERELEQERAIRILDSISTPFLSHAFARVIHCSLSVGEETTRTKEVYGAVVRLVNSLKEEIQEFEWFYSGINQLPPDHPLCEEIQKLHPRHFSLFL